MIFLLNQTIRNEKHLKKYYKKMKKSEGILLMVLHTNI